MGVVEIVFPKVDEDASVRQAFHDEWPPIGRETVGQAEGYRVGFLAEIISSQGDGVQPNPGYIPIIVWDDVQSVTNFLQSPPFARLKALLVKYVTESSLELYESLETDARSLLIESPSVHLFKITTSGGPEDLAGATEAWSTFGDAVKEAGKSAGQDEPLFYAADGVKQVEGVHFGLIGWRNQMAAERVFESAEVKAALSNLQKTNGVKDVSLLLAKLNLVNDAGERK